MSLIRPTKPNSSLQLLPKIPTGINGLDEITDVGLSGGRPTLICGSAGCGKTLFSIEFIVRGALEYGECDLEGLFIRLGYAIGSIGAKRVVLDTIENLFAGLTNQGRVLL